MKKFLLLSMAICLVWQVEAQEKKSIKLNVPDVKRGLSVMAAFKNRQSVREFADKALSLQDLSDLLWAAVGVNRPESGKRTAPSALNKQEIDVYVCMPDGAYLYDAKEHVLNLIAKGDYRKLVAASQEWAKTAPLAVVIVADMNKFNGESLMPAVDAGIVSQNISLFCAGTGLVTVPRGTMDANQLEKILKLREGQRVILNHPVGYPK